MSSLLHPARLMASGIVRREQVHVYLDVSGSMDAALPALYATLASLSGLLHPKVHLFSTRIDDIDLRQLARGVRVTTGGTDIAPVTRHALDHRVKRALFVTDGWVGEVPDEHAHELAKRGARFAAVVTHNGRTGFRCRPEREGVAAPQPGETHMKRMTKSNAAVTGRHETAEFVLPGHPDKLCDAVADSIIDWHRQRGDAMRSAASRSPACSTACS